VSHVAGPVVMKVRAAERTLLRILITDSTIVDVSSILVNGVTLARSGADVRVGRDKTLAFVAMQRNEVVTVTFLTAPERVIMSWQ